MKTLFGKTNLLAATIVLTLGSAACGQMENLLNKAEDDSSQSISSDTETANLMESSYSSSLGSNEPSLRPFPLDGLEIGAEQPDAAGRHGRGGSGGRGHPGKKPPHGPGKGKGPASLPAEIQALMKSADTKKASVLSIDLAKVDEVLKSMRTDLESLRMIAVSREDFQTQAKVIQDKYTSQLKTILPAFEALTQEQKDRVKAIHDLQKGVIDSCVARGADSSSAACSSAKSALQGNIDAP
jgi:hypothetical protein